MEIEIRLATLYDVSRIAEIIELAFDETPDLNRISHQVLLHQGSIYVAVQNNRVIGFVENFVTTSHDSKLRLELDLLAVHPDAQGQGIGRRLIEASIQLARELKVNYIRALIAFDNHPMRYLCSSYRLLESMDIKGLYIAQTTEIAKQLVHQPDSNLIRVDTLTYSGIWQEGEITQNAINNAQSTALQYRCDVVGIVTPKSNSIIQLLNDNQFSHVNDYHHWILNL